MLTRSCTELLPTVFAMVCISLIPCVSKVLARSKRRFGLVASCVMWARTWVNMTGTTLTKAPPRSDGGSSSNTSSRTPTTTTAHTCDGWAVVGAPVVDASGTRCSWMVCPIARACGASSDGSSTAVPSTKGCAAPAAAPAATNRARSASDCEAMACEMVVDKGQGRWLRATTDLATTRHAPRSWHAARAPSPPETRIGSWRARHSCSHGSFHPPSHLPSQPQASTRQQTPSHTTTGQSKLAQTRAQHTTTQHTNPC